MVHTTSASESSLAAEPFPLYCSRSKARRARLVSGAWAVREAVRERRRGRRERPRGRGVGKGETQGEM